MEDILSLILSDNELTAVDRAFWHLARNDMEAAGRFLSCEVQGGGSNSYETECAMDRVYALDDPAIFRMCKRPIDLLAAVRNGATAIMDSPPGDGLYVEAKKLPLTPRGYRESQARLSETIILPKNGPLSLFEVVFERTEKSLPMLLILLRRCGEMQEIMWAPEDFQDAIVTRDMQLLEHVVTHLMPSAEELRLDFVKWGSPLPSLPALQYLERILGTEMQFNGKGWNIGNVRVLHVDTLDVLLNRLPARWASARSTRPRSWARVPPR